MKKLLALFFLLTPVLIQAEETKTKYNPFTGKLDFITKVDSTTLPSGSTNYIQNTLTPTTTSQQFNVAYASAGVVLAASGTVTDLNVVNTARFYSGTIMSSGVIVQNGNIEIKRDDFNQPTIILNSETVGIGVIIRFDEFGVPVSYITSDPFVGFNIYNSTSGSTDVVHRMAFLNSAWRTYFLDKQLVFDNFPCSSYANGGKLTTDSSGFLACADDTSGSVGGGSSSLAVSSRNVSGSVTQVSSPTVALVGRYPIVATLTGGATAEFSADPSSFTLQGNVFNGANQLIQADGGGVILDADIPVGVSRSTVAVSSFPTVAAQTGKYTNADVTVDLYGRVVAIATGTAGSGSGSSIYPATSTIFVPGITFTSSGVYKTDTYSSGAGYCAVSSGCSSPSQFVTNTTSTNFVGATFSYGTTSYWEMEAPLPENYVAGSTLTARINYTSTATTGNMLWNIEMKVSTGGTTMDGSFGTAATATGSHLGAYFNSMTAESSAITPAGTLVGGSSLFIRVYRGVGNSDTITAPVVFKRIRITYPITQISARTQ